MGPGYIGLSTAAPLATKGHKVHGVDLKPEVIDTIHRGLIYIVEPLMREQQSLLELIRNLLSGKLQY